MGDDPAGTRNRWLQPDCGRGLVIALGIQRTDVLILVLKKAAWLLSIGLVSGLAGSWFATRAIKVFLFGVDQLDPITILSVCVLLAV